MSSDRLIPPHSLHPEAPQAAPLPSERQRELLQELLLLISSEKQSIARRVSQTQAHQEG